MMGFKAVGRKIFRVMINWCMMAMRKGATQGEFILNKEFALITEIVNPKTSAANSWKSHQSRGTVRSEDVEMTEEEKNATPADEEDDSKLPPQKCICLASSP
jgi:hypothetical protein